MVRIARRDGGHAGKTSSELHGVVVIDKPVGPTSHDVVALLRRTLGTRAIGHAGTLDPAASGVLVIVVGQATKLVPYLTAQSKRYEATVELGTSTTTLDREGAVVETKPVPPEISRELGGASDAPRPRLEAALAKERARALQVPPVFSALKQGGRSVHERARRGEHVELPPRSIEVRSLEIVRTTATSIDLALDVAKGYYVRALARDLGETLGVPAHLGALRRLSSGPFDLGEALAENAPRDALCASLLPLAQAAARALPVCRMSQEGAERARRGQVLGDAHFVEPPGGGMSAWIDPSGELVAIGRTSEPGRFVVERGFSHSTSSAAT
jgi:tRNA pseudouridine55 synthase